MDPSDRYVVALLCGVDNVVKTVTDFVASTGETGSPTLADVLAPYLGKWR